AEDGIRDRNVTGVQTCALPIFTSNLVVGNAAFSAAQVWISGGSVNVTNAGEPAFLSVANGTLSLSEGTIVTDSLLLTNSSGLINFNGGRLETKGTVVANGAPFTVGDGTTAATL